MGHSFSVWGYSQCGGGTSNFSMSSGESGKIKEEEQGSKKRSAILVIDDDEQLCDLTAEFLSGSGYRVYKAGSGEEALRLFSSHPQEIRLVIADIGLVGMGGNEVLQKVRDIDPLIKTVAMSGFGGEEMLREVRASHADIFI